MHAPSLNSNLIMWNFDFVCIYKHMNIEYVHLYRCIYIWVCVYSSAS